MIKVFMLNPKAERQASPGVPYVELSDYLSLESRHRDLVAAARKLFDLPAKTDDTKTALALLDLREALKDESNPPGEAPK